MCPYDKRRRVLRRSGQCGDPALSIARQTDVQQGVMVWNTISFDSHFCHIDCRVASWWYSTTGCVSIPFVTPWIYLKHDNARLNCLRAWCTITWLARSPDLSPIKHTWDIIGKTIATVQGTRRFSPRVRNNLVRNSTGHLSDTSSICKTPGDNRVKNFERNVI